MCKKCSRYWGNDTCSMNRNHALYCLHKELLFKELTTLTSSSAAVATSGTVTELLAPDRVTAKVPPVASLTDRVCTSRMNPASEEITIFCTSATPADGSVISIFVSPRGLMGGSLYWRVGRSPRRACALRKELRLYLEGMKCVKCRGETLAS